MKRIVEGTLLLFLALNSAELLWRRFIWAQSPPEVPFWAFAALLLLNGVVLTNALRARLSARG